MLLSWLQQIRELLQGTVRYSQARSACQHSLILLYAGFECRCANAKWLYQLQITCNRCSIQNSTEMSNQASVAAPPATNLEPSPALLSASNETSSPGLAPAVASPLLPAGASNSTLKASEIALAPNAPSVTSYSSPTSQLTGKRLAAAPSPMVSPNSSYMSTLRAPADERISDQQSVSII